jgi:capping protein beta
MIEEMENKMRSTLNAIYFGKTKDIVNDLRSMESRAAGASKRMMSMKIADALKGRSGK